jgi:transposase
MSLQLKALPPVPAETARVARAAFPKGNRYLTLRDELGSVYTDEAFAELFAGRGQPAESPALLALVTVLQFAENLSDREAADQVRGRIDWKYLLGLPLEDAGFDYSLLSEFRGRLLQGDAQHLLLDQLLQLARERKLLQARGRQRTDATHVLAAIRELNRLEIVGETLRHALNSLAQVAPEWLRGWVPAEWFERYGRRIEQFRLPRKDSERLTWARQVGTDGARLLAAAYDPQAPAVAHHHPAVDVLRQVWIQQFYWEDDQIDWRGNDNLPPAALAIESPYDPQARYSYKRDTEWTGYKGHLTETCDPDQPALITQVTTTPATTPDAQALPAVQADLAAKDLLPGTHLVDAGYTTAANLAESQATHQVDLLGPVPADTTRQAQQQQGFDLTHFTIDWELQRVTCPRGQPNVTWSESHNEFDHPVIHIRFAAAACRACPVRSACVQSATGPRSLKLRPREQHQALQAARQRQAQAAFGPVYAKRAGIESTHSQAVRVCDFRRSRYWGLAKTHLQHVLSAVALNFIRLADWFARPDLRHRRPSAFVALAGALPA